MQASYDDATLRVQSVGGETVVRHEVHVPLLYGESHATVELREGKNREVRRLFEAIGHEVTRLSRVQLGGLGLDGLQPGAWRDLSREEVARAFGL